MSPSIRNHWWIVPAILLAGLHVFTAVANWRPPGWDRIDPFAVYILAAGVATLAGVAVRNRAPKLSGLLMLTGVWIPLLGPTYSLIVQVFRPDAAWIGVPREYFGLVGVLAAVMTTVGAIQNMTRRPPGTARGDGKLRGGLSAPASP